MKYKFEIIQTGEDAHEDDNYTEVFSDLKKLMLGIFEEWEGMGWIKKSGFMPDKSAYLISFFITKDEDYRFFVLDGYEYYPFEILNLESLNQTINIIFNSFKSGYEKKYKIEEVRT